MFRKKCPQCKVRDVEEPDSLMPGLFLMSPMLCRNCDHRFEHWIVIRVVFAIYVVVIALLGVFADTLVQQFGKPRMTALGLPFMIGGVAALFIFSAYREFQDWSENKRVRQIVNYGAIILIAITAGMFLMKKYYADEFF